jgi:hypothetical protein
VTLCATVVLATVLLVLALVPAAGADVRTGRTHVSHPERGLSDEFPGLAGVSVRYDDATGAFDLSAQLRSSLADPQTTSALRSTTIDITLNDFYGDDLLTGNCQSHIDGVRVQLLLGSSQAAVELGTSFDGSDDWILPLSVSADRREVSVSVPADSRLGVRNIICIEANLTGPEGLASNAPQDFTADRLLDGFSGRDGNIGSYAGDDVESQFRYVYNNFTDRERDEILNHPSWSGVCTPKSGTVIVSCRGRSRIGTIVGRPAMTIRGRRIYETHRGKGVLVGDRGVLLRWRQSMRVVVRWRRCPRPIDARRASCDAACTVALTWRTGQFLSQRLANALIRRAKRTGIPPRRVGN